jgi:hypothetical protein
LSTFFLSALGTRVSTHCLYLTESFSVFWYLTQCWSRDCHTCHCCSAKISINLAMGKTAIMRSRCREHSVHYTFIRKTKCSKGCKSFNLIGHSLRLGASFLANKIIWVDLFVLVVVGKRGGTLRTTNTFIARCEIDFVVGCVVGHRECCQLS